VSEACAIRGGSRHIMELDRITLVDTMKIDSYLIREKADWK